MSAKQQKAKRKLKKLFAALVAAAEKKKVDSNAK